MKFFNRGTALISIISLLVLAGCGDGQAEKEEIEPVKTEASEEVTEEKIPSPGRTIEEMVGQKAGVLIERHMDQQLETLGGWDGQKYLDFLKQTFNPLVEKEIKTYFSEHADLNGEEVYDYLVHMLGSGNYASYYEQLTAYDHGYSGKRLSHCNASNPAGATLHILEASEHCLFNSRIKCPPRYKKEWRIKVANWRLKMKVAIIATKVAIIHLKVAIK